MDAKKMMNEMRSYGFDFNELATEIELTKTYKCYLSKKCNDEKYARIKKMFDFVKDDPKFKDYMGKDMDKLAESFANEARGEVKKTIDFDGMSTMDAFVQHKVGVKEVCKKGYTVENDIYVKVAK